MVRATRSCCRQLKHITLMTTYSRYHVIKPEEKIYRLDTILNYHHHTSGTDHILHSGPPQLTTIESTMILDALLLATKVISCFALRARNRNDRNCLRPSIAAQHNTTCTKPS